MDRSEVENYVDIWVAKIALAGGALKLTVHAFEAIKSLITDELLTVLKIASTYSAYVRDAVISTKIVNQCIPFSIDCENSSMEVCEYPKEKDSKRRNRLKQAKYYQKHSHQLMIDFNFFSYILTHYSLYVDNNQLFNDNAALIIQHYLQSYAINIISHSMSFVEFKKPLTTYEIQLSRTHYSPTINAFPYDTKRVDGNNYYQIVLVLKQVHPNIRISVDAVKQLDNFIFRMVNIIASKAKFILNTFGESKGIDLRTVQTVIRQVIIPENLLRYAISEGAKAVTKYNKLTDKPATSTPSIPQNSKKLLKPTKETRAAMSGLVFNVQLIHNLMKEVSGEKVTNDAAVYLAAVCEYFTAEILELSGNVCRDDRKVTITSRHIDIAVDSDVELRDLFRTNAISRRLSLGKFSKKDNSSIYVDHYKQLTEMVAVHKDIVSEDKDSRFIEEEDEESEEDSDEEDYVVPELVRAHEDEHSHTAACNFVLILNEWADEEEDDDDEEGVDEEEEDEEEEDEEDEEDEEIDPKIAKYVKKQTDRLEQEIETLKMRFG